MKITKIETFQLESKLDRPFGWSQGWIDRRHVGVVKISTDAGIVGWGEGCNAPAATIIHQVFAPYLIGADAMNRVGHWQTMLSTLYNANHAVGVGGNAISAIDIALWDIAGKVLDAPVCDLLGGRVRDKVAAYATGLYYTEGEFPNRLLDEARGYVDLGFKGMKTKVGGLPLDEDVARVTAIRETIGPDQLMVDANQGYNASTAIRIGRRLAELDLLWFEEPVNAKDLDGYLQVKANVPISIAGGEVLRTRYEFRDAIKLGVFDIVQPDIGNVGGITEMVKVALTGAVEAGRRYHQALGADPDRFHITFVVSTRTDAGTANAFSPVPVEVPAGAMSLRERFAVIHQRLQARRAEVHGGGPMATIAAVVNLLPTRMVTGIIRNQAGHIDFATSNVPGFLGDTWVAGAKTLHTYAWGPVAGTAFNITQVSTAGHLDIGVHVDPAAVTDPGLLQSCLEDSYRDLLDAPPTG